MTSLFGNVPDIALNIKVNIERLLSLSRSREGMFLVDLSPYRGRVMVEAKNSSFLFSNFGIVEVTDRLVDHRVGFR